MKLRRRIFVVGGDLTPFIGKMHPDFIWKKHPDFGTRENPTLEQSLSAAINGALESTGVDAAQIEKGFIGNFAGELFSNQGHMGALAVRANAGLHGKPFSRVEGACASGGLAIVSCIDALLAGYDVVMAAGAEVQTSVSARDGAGYLARAAHWDEERSIDEFTFPAMFARRAKAYKAKYDVTDEDIAHVVAKAYANANKNPNAHMREVKVDLAHASKAGDTNPCFLANTELKDHLKVSDCSQVSDGGAAIILASEEGLKKLGKRPEDCVEILSYGQATGPLGQVADYTVLDTTALAAQEAYRDAGIGPDDVQVCEVHDCFAVTEVLMYEALGFAAPGKGTELAKQGETGIEGRIPVNTGGGLIAFGHPVGATGVKQVLEIFRQMKGLCGDYQIPNSPKIGLTANMGGDDRSSVCITLRNVE
ncbi:MAG: thiolase domain-containing protein [Bradymonadaceae bacterium]|nr:thiolase domain-containing protein [Lujinxingiaceae bacterium]